MSSSFHLWHCEQRIRREEKGKGQNRREHRKGIEGRRRGEQWGGGGEKGRGQEDRGNIWFQESSIGKHMLHVDSPNYGSLKTKKNKAFLGLG